MWIIPKNLTTSHSVRDMEESTLDSQELSEMCVQSLMWRSKPSQSKTWSRRLRTTCSTWLLFGRISKPSPGRCIVERWTSSLEASLVSHLVQQDDAQETKTPATSSLTSSTGFDSWENLPLFSSRMSKASSHQSSREMNGATQRKLLFCSMSSESWRDWVTTRRREYSQRVKSARPISGSGSLFWLVAPISATQDALLFQGCLRMQSSQTCIWLTPAADAGNAREPLFTASGELWTGDGRAYRRNGMHRTLTLNMQVSSQPTPHQEAQSNINGSLQGSQWATPNTLDYLAQRSEEGLKRQATTSRKGRTSPANLREQVNPIASKIYLQWAMPEAGSKDHSSSNPAYYQSRRAKGKQIYLNGQAIEEEKSTQKKLNPRWVESLMGLPIGWVMPSCQDPWIIGRMNLDCLEMELSQTQPSEHLKNYGEASDENL